MANSAYEQEFTEERWDALWLTTIDMQFLKFK